MSDMEVTFGVVKPNTKSGRKKRNRKDDRPWLLGTDEIPPPLDVPWQMWSQSSNPHEGGLIRFEFTREGLIVGYVNEEKGFIAWHELAWMTGNQPRDLQEEIQYIREFAQAEAFAIGMARALKEWRDKVLGKPFLASYGDEVKEAIAAIDALMEKHPRLKECL